jgi:proteasome lid subunit RPN8/RPN11
MKEKRKPSGARGEAEKGAKPNDGERGSTESAPKAATPLRITQEMLTAQAPVAIAADVVQQMHRHARSYMHAEVCGVLIGEEVNGVTVIDAAIAGEGAAQGGAHVTFTQDTWEHIYAVKDRDYADKRIVGWYHSHPGFGIFLSQQDLFIHENFFSSPAQVAWVYDPHSDEEGCFGWVDGKVKRLREIRVVEVEALDAPVVGEEPDEIPETAETEAMERLGGGEAPAPQRKRSLGRMMFLLLAMTVMFVAGFAGGVFLFPRNLVMYSLPDGRLLSREEMQAAVERALERQKGEGVARPEDPAARPGPEEKP